MKSKELFTIKFGTANKSGAGFLLEEIKTVLLVCKGRCSLEEFLLISNVCHNQVKEKEIVACIADFALMDTDMVEDYIKIFQTYTHHYWQLYYLRKYRMAK